MPTDQKVTVLRLFVTGRTGRADRAIAMLRNICENELKGEYELSIVDVLENPEIAESERVIATPTLVKRLPPPMRRIIGDLSDREKVLMGLQIDPP